MVGNFYKKRSNKSRCFTKNIFLKDTCSQTSTNICVLNEFTMKSYSKTILYYVSLIHKLPLRHLQHAFQLDEIGMTLKVSKARTKGNSKAKQFSAGMFYEQVIHFCVLRFVLGSFFASCFPDIFELCEINWKGRYYF